MTIALVGNSIAVTDTATPGAVVYTAGGANTITRVQVRATNVGSTLRVVTLEHDRGASHPAGTGIVDVVDGFTLLIEGFATLIWDGVIYGDGADPDTLAVFISAGTVNISVVAEEVS